MKKINTQKVLLIPREKISIDINTITLKEKKKIAEKDLTLEEFMNFLNATPNFNTEYYSELYDENPDYLFIKIGETEDSVELVINNHAEFHICRNDHAYSVDVYKYFPQNSNHDFMGDDVFSLGWVDDQDIKELSGSED